MCKNGVNDQNKNTTENRESDNMLALNKPNQATIINNGNTKSFFSEMYSKRATKEYWAECSKTSKKINASSMSILKQRCNSECK